MVKLIESEDLCDDVRRKYAAAALTGLLAGHLSKSPSDASRKAFEFADAMMHQEVAQSSAATQRARLEQAARKIT